jgi:hypothetical protein
MSQMKCFILNIDKNLNVRFFARHFYIMPIRFGHLVPRCGDNIISGGGGSCWHLLLLIVAVVGCILFCHWVGMRPPAPT